MFNVAYNPVMLNVLMLSVVRLNVVILSVVTPMDAFYMISFIVFFPQTYNIYLTNGQEDLFKMKSGRVSYSH
jgi:hypothetical protein